MQVWWTFAHFQHFLVLEAPYIFYTVIVIVCDRVMIATYPMRTAPPPPPTHTVWHQAAFCKYQSYKLNTCWQCEWWKQVKLKCDLPVWVKFPRWFCSSPFLRARDLGLSKAYQFSTKLVAAFLAYFWFTDVVLFYFPSIFCTRVSCSGSLQRLERIPAWIRWEASFT